jgi:serine/threonine protein kinase
MDRAAGTVLAGKYALVSKLGQGGMGAVWRAEHVQLRSPVAIKLIDNQIASNPEALARFMREAQSAAALRSPHVVQILDFGADNGVPYIAMELLEGESLAARIERTRGLTPAETAHIITQVARAVSKAHEGGIVHRDLKPDNIFIVKNDEEEVAKVLDFGIAKASSTFGPTTGSNTRTGAILGTPYYMSRPRATGSSTIAPIYGPSASSRSSASLAEGPSTARRSEVFCSPSARVQSPSLRAWRGCRRGSTPGSRGLARVSSLNVSSQRESSPQSFAACVACRGELWRSRSPGGPRDIPYLAVRQLRTSNRSPRRIRIRRAST